MSKQALTLEEIELFIMTDDPECCRKCGARVFILDDSPSTNRAFTRKGSPSESYCEKIVCCPNCGFKYGLCEDDKETE